MFDWLRGLALLRYPELVRDLGERRFHLNRVAEIEGASVDCKIDRDIRLVGYSKQHLEIGDNVSVGAGSVLAFGDEQNGFGIISIGQGTWIGQYNNLRAGGGDIHIGNDCLISQFCTLVASNHSAKREATIQQQPPSPERSGVRLGNDVWLGAGVVVTAGMTIGSGAIVGAGSVVTKEIPEYEIWAGTPATKIGIRD